MSMRRTQNHLLPPLRFSKTTRSLTGVAALCLAAASLAGIAACGKKHRVATASVPRPPVQKPMTAVPIGYTEEGVASWYGHPYHGRPAADGEIYDMEKLVAAHRVMPFNTWVRVSNLQNGKSIDVRIIDRGPFVAGRIIDLSKAAARQIDLLGPGTGRVRLQVIAAPAYVPGNDLYAVQIGAFAIHANAEHLREEYEQCYGAAQLAQRESNPPLWRVLVGRERSLAAAQQLAATLAGTGRNVFVVRLDSLPPGIGATQGGTLSPRREACLVAADAEDRRAPEKAAAAGPATP